MTTQNAREDGRVGDVFTCKSGLFQAFRWWRANEKCPHYVSFAQCSEQAITKGTEKIDMRDNLTLKTGGRLREAPTYGGSTVD